MALPVISKYHLLTARRNTPTKSTSQQKKTFSLANIDIPPTDSYKVIYEAPYFSPSGKYEGEWYNPTSGAYSDEKPIRLFWVLTDGDAVFSVDVNQGVIKKRTKTIIIKNPQDGMLIDYDGIVKCKVSFCRWLIVCKYTCSKSILKREIELHLCANEITRRHHENVARQIMELLNSKGYREFDDIFR